MEFTMEDIEFKKPRNNSIIEGTVVLIEDGYVLLDCNYVTEGKIYKDKLTLEDVESCFDVVEIGQKIKAVVKKADDENLLLSCIDLQWKEKKAEAYNAVKELFDNNEIVSVKVKKSVKGGLMVALNDVELFLPDSLIDVKKVDKEEFVGKDIDVQIIEFTNKKAIVSRKKVIAKEFRKLAKEEFNTLEVGQVLTGTVTRIETFGAFVKFEYNEGLLHISELSHNHDKVIGDKLKIGDEVEVKIIKKDHKKIGLSKRALMKTPWQNFEEKNPVGSTITGKITKKLDFGVLIQLDENIIGMMHRNEYSHNPKDNFAKDLSEDQEIEVKILSMDKKTRKVALSKKALIDNPWLHVTCKRGQIVKGLVSKLTLKGAEVLVQGVTVFVPTKELSTERISKPEDALKVNEEYDFEVVNVDLKDWRMALSIKTILDRKNREEYENYLDTQEEEESTTLGDLFGDHLNNLK